MRSTLQKKCICHQKHNEWHQNSDEPYQIKEIYRVPKSLWSKLSSINSEIYDKIIKIRQKKNCKVYFCEKCINYISNCAGTSSSQAENEGENEVDQHNESMDTSTEPTEINNTNPDMDWEINTPSDVEGLRNLAFDIGVKIRKPILEDAESLRLLNSLDLSIDLRNYIENRNPVIVRLLEGLSNVSINTCDDKNVLCRFAKTLEGVEGLVLSKQVPLTSHKRESLLNTNETLDVMNFKKDEFSIPESTEIGKQSPTPIVIIPKDDVGSTHERSLCHESELLAGVNKFECCLCKLLLTSKEMYYDHLKATGHAQNPPQTIQ